MTSRRFVAVLALLAGASVPAPAIAAPTPEQRVERVLKAVPLIDGHNDIAEQLSESHGFSVANLASGTDRWADHPLMTDMARLRAGRVGGQFWSVYIDGELKGDEAIRRTLEQIDIVDRMIAAYPQDLEKALTADDIERIHRKGRVASLIGIEGGRQIGGSMAALRQFYRLGARYMTLTHNQTNALADSATDDPVHGGLTPFGRAVIGEMNRLGMLVDLSHVAPSTMRQAIAASRAPVIFSHSSARALNDHPRNVPDDVLQSLRTRDGVVMVNWVPAFVDRTLLLWQAEGLALEARLKALHKGNPDAVKAGLAAWKAAHPEPKVGIAQVAAHYDHVARIAGHDHVGLGADLDGIPYAPDGLGGVDRYPALLAELARRGWSDDQLAALAGGNVLRVLRKAEAVSRQMAAAPPAMDKPGPTP